MANTSAHAVTAGTETPLFEVIKGNPDPQQVAALTTVLAGLLAEARAEEAKRPATRNLWGNYEERLQQTRLYNPGAFQNVNFS